jgi:predicted NBD/HSP70 family sugar kinase
MARSSGFEGTNLDTAHSYNRNLVIEAIRVHRMLSRADLTRLTGLAPQTISNITASLIAADLILTERRGGGGRGQPPVDLSLNPRGGYAFGASIGKQHVLVVLVNLRGDQIGKVAIDAERAPPDRVLRDVTAAVRNLRRRHLRTNDRVLGTGVAMTGLTTGGHFIGLAPDDMIAQWRDRSLAAELGRALNMPIFTDNDARAAAVGEALHGEGRRYRDFVYLYFGVGIGGGIIHAGQPFRGCYGRAGEFGHMIVRPGGRACPCGNRGCLERYASLSSALEALDRPGADPSTVLAEALAAGDVRLEAWVDAAAECLQTAIVNIENIFDPETVLLGGVLPEPLLDALYRRILPLPRSVASQRSDPATRVKKSTPGPTIPAMGAASLALFDATSAASSLLFKSNGEAPRPQGGAMSGQSRRGSSAPSSESV